MRSRNQIVMHSKDYLTRHDMERVPREPSLNSRIETQQPCLFTIFGIRMVLEE
jgi:hypothetical protein